MLCVFGSLVKCGFTEWDDPATLAQNPRLNPPSISSVAYYWGHAERGLYTPATYLVWSVLAAAGQHGLPNGYGSTLKPSLFHTANVILHALNAVMVYAILRELLKKPGAALVGAMLFALHPVQVEAVAWASGLKDVMCGSFTLAALWQFICWSRSPELRRRAIYATVFFAAAMLSKPTAMVSPLLAWVIAVWLLEMPWRRAMILPGIWCALAIPIFLVTRFAQQTGINIVQVDPLLRPLVAGDALAFYMRQIAWPAHLAVDYSRSPANVLARPITQIIWLAPALIGALIFLSRRHRRLVGGALLFAIPVLPVLGFQPFMMQYISTVADHYLYLPMFGISMGVAYWLSGQTTQKWYAIATLLLVALGVRSALQARFWKDDESLNRHTLAVNPDSFTGHINLSADLKQRGDFTGALAESAAAVRCNPDFVMARSNYLIMLATLNHFDEAMQQSLALAKLMDQVPPENRGHFVCGMELLGRKLIWDHQPERAMDVLNLALRIDPGNKDAAYDLKQAESALAELPED